MNFQLTFKVSDKIFLKDPESTELGKKMIKNSIDLIKELGFEHFTFKKLALKVSTTEATVYRYFENKHRLLLYILNWYWSYLEFLVIFNIQNSDDPKSQLQSIIKLLSRQLPKGAGDPGYNKTFLHEIVITESSKVYLVKEVNEINKDQAFKPYKDLCGKIAEIISNYNPEYKYPRSLSSTLVESSHFQHFFSDHLPKLTDTASMKKEEYVSDFLNDFLFKILDR